MAHSQDNRQLIGPARRRAFETYLRFGRWPEDRAKGSEHKAVNPATPLPTALPRRPTRFYVWRSTGDNRVRHSHAARHGRVFAWDDPPSGGHPGTEPNCRCWPDPYYGDPTVPDALQPLHHAQQIDTSGKEPWASIETLTRSDGSMAQSVVLAPDGTTIRSRFLGASILRTVTLPNGQAVRIDTESGLQSIYLGTDSVPLFQSRWTATGPKVVRARRHVAFLLERDPFDDPLRPDSPAHLLGGGSGGFGGGGGSGSIDLGAIVFALTSLFAVHRAAPASQGLGEEVRPTIVYPTWTAGMGPEPDAEPRPVYVGALSEGQIRQSCRRVVDVQNWINEAAAELAPQKANLTAQAYGMALHLLLHQKIQALKLEYPGLMMILIPKFRSLKMEHRFREAKSTAYDTTSMRRYHRTNLRLYVSMMQRLVMLAFAGTSYRELSPVRPTRILVQPSS